MEMLWLDGNSSDNKEGDKWEEGKEWETSGEEER